MRPISRTDRTPRTYQRRFTISGHALDRFRERVDEEFRHRDANDLGNLLDEKLCHSGERNEVKDHRAPSSQTFLYTIEMRSGGVFYVVVRDDTAITVLDPDMARRNFSEAWKPVLINSPFKGLQKLIDSAPTSQSTLKNVSVSSVPLAVVPAPDPIEALGIRHAKALRRERECQIRLGNAHVEAKRVVDAAELALKEAREEAALAAKALADEIG